MHKRKLNARTLVWFEAKLGEWRFRKKRIPDSSRKRSRAVKMMRT